MNKIIGVILFISYLLSGCVSQEEKILDFAGIVFFIFFLIVVVQLSSDKIVSLPIYKKLHDFSTPARRFVPPIATSIGIITFLFGMFSEGLIKISMLIGLIIVLFGWFMKQYNRGDFNDKQRSTYGKLMIVCLTFIICLCFLMKMAPHYIKL